MSSSSISKVEFIKWAVVIGLSAIFLLIPEQGFYTYQFKMFITITVFGLSLAAFEIVPVLLISIIMPALWILFEVAPAATVMSPWVGSTFLMIVGAFFMGATLGDCGLLKRLSFYLLCQVKGKYFSLLVSIMAVAILLNILTFGRAYLIITPLAAGLCISLNGMKKNLGVGIAAAVMLGACTSHAYTYQASNWAVLLRMSEGYIAHSDVTPLGIILHNWPMFFISLLILFLISKWYKPEESLGEVTYFKEQLNKLGAITRREKVNALMLLIVLTYALTVNIHKMDINLGFAILPWLVYLPFLKGADDNTIKKVNLSMIFFVAACMGIGTVAGSLGVGELISELCKTLLNGRTSATAAMAILFAIIFGLNFLMTPLAIFALIMNPIAMLATDLGFSALPFAYAINACSEAIILPYEYVPYLVVFSFGMMSMKDFVKVNILRSLLFFGGFLLLQVPYWLLIGLL